MKAFTRIIFVVILSVFSMADIYAQAPDWEWAKSVGTEDRDKSTDIATDKDGNVYVVGFFESLTITFGDFTLTNTSMVGFDDIFIV